MYIFWLTSNECQKVLLFMVNPKPYSLIIDSLTGGSMTRGVDSRDTLRLLTRSFKLIKFSKHGHHQDTNQVTDSERKTFRLRIIKLYTSINGKHRYITLWFILYSIIYITQILGTFSDPYFLVIVSAIIMSFCSFMSIINKRSLFHQFLTLSGKSRLRSPDNI